LGWRSSGRSALRIEFYDTRVAECVALLEQRFAASIAAHARVAAGQAALHRAAHQPSAARTGRDLLQLGVHDASCTAAYFHNDFIFVRPALSTEYIENDEPSARPTYRAYYPTPARRCARRCRAWSPTSS
jgi:isocitrate dehydrogenase kinase/phosphatase